MFRRIAIFSLTIFLLFQVDLVFADDEVLKQSSRLEVLSAKVDRLIARVDEDTSNRTENIIGLANLQMQLITVILTVVALGLPLAAYVFRKHLKDIEDKAMLSVANMNKEVNKIKLSEKAIRIRKDSFDKLYSEIEKREATIDKRIVKLRDLKGKPVEKQKLEELENEVLGLKRRLSQGIQPYVWSTPFPAGSASGYVGPIDTISYPEYRGVTTTTVSPSPSMSPTTTTTVEPFYSSPSASPSPEPPEDENES